MNAARPRVNPEWYIPQEDGTVYSVGGGFFYSREVWEQYERENKAPWADHDFRLGGRVEEAGSEQWHRVWATCERCGELRRVYHAVPMGTLNAGWCVMPPEPPPAPPAPLGVLTRWARRLAGVLS